MTDSSPPAERVRSVLSQALTAQVFRDGSPEPVDRAMGEIQLSAGLGAAERRVAATCVVEVADAAPVPMRERIRGRVRIAGHEVRSECAALHVAVDEVTLAVGRRSVTLSVEEVLDARPDPLAASEAVILTHLVTAHGEVLRALLPLLPEADLQGAVSVRPLRLDRHGVELRIEHVRGHRDHQLEFEPPVATADELPTALTRLVARAQATSRRPCARASAWPAAGSVGGPVDAILRAAEAARRLCGP